MKVLILSHQYPHASNSTIGCFVHEQVKALRERCEVIVVSPTPVTSPIMRRLKAHWPYYAEKAKKTEVEGVEVYHPRYMHLPTKWGFTIDGFSMRAALKDLFDQLKKTFSFDLIHAHTLCPDGFAATRLGLEMDVPVVCTIHGSDINIYPHWTRFNEVATQHTIKNTDALITVSEKLKEKTLTFESPRHEIRIIPNGVDLQQFVPQDKHLSRSELDLPQDRPIIVYASRIEEAKGLSFLLTAQKTLVARGSDSLLVLVGDGQYRETLIKKITELELGSNVLLAGRKPHAEVAKWINASDLVVLPSLSEGSPLVVYEALACGRPVVASQVGGIPEIIPHEDYGLLVPPGDAEALTEALIHGLEKEWNVRQIREYGAKYSWTNVAGQLTSLYKELLNGQMIH